MLIFWSFLRAIEAFSFLLVSGFGRKFTLILFYSTEEEEEKEGVAQILYRIHSTMQEILYSMNDSKSIIKCTLKKCVYTKTALCCCKVFQEMQNTLVYLICQLPRQIIIRRKKSVKNFFFVQQKWLQNYCYVCIVSVFMTFYRKKCKQ